MPIVILPLDLTEELQQSETGTINDTETAGVAVYWSSDRRTRADIHVGFKFDGFKRFWDINSVYPDLKMQFSEKPVIFCNADDFDFDPNKDKLIAVKVIVQRMKTGK